MINCQKLASFHNRSRQHRWQSGFGIRTGLDSWLLIGLQRKAPVTLWCWSMVRTTQKRFQRRHSRSRRSCRDELVRHLRSRRDRLPACGDGATFHPKDGALAQQPKAERAPHSAVVRPQAAGKSRSTSPMLVSVRFLCCRRIGVRDGYLVKGGPRAEFGREGRARRSLRRGEP